MARQQKNMNSKKRSHNRKIDFSVVDSIHINKDFGVPFGRYYDDGNHSGERFQKEFLAPLLENHEKITLDFSESTGVSSGFLEECFGGYIRNNDVDPSYLDKINFIFAEGYIDTQEDVETYVKEAYEYKINKEA